MTVRIWERFGSRDTHIGLDAREVERLFMIDGTTDDVVVVATIEEEIPLEYNGLLRQNYSFRQTGGPDIWEVLVQYSTREQFAVGESTYQFDTSGETVRIVKSLATISRHSLVDGTDPPDYKGLINVTPDGVEGVDVVVPSFSFGETHFIDPDLVTVKYKKALARLTGCVNDAPFLGFEKGELLFRGASGSKRGTDRWEITFRFSGVFNEKGLKLIDTGSESDPTVDKEGWQYLWFQTEEVKDDDANILVKRPRYAFLEQVRPYGDFRKLLIGG